MTYALLSSGGEQAHVAYAEAVANANVVPPKYGETTDFARARVLFARRISSFLRSSGLLLCTACSAPLIEADHPQGKEKRVPLSLRMIECLLIFQRASYRSVDLAFLYSFALVHFFLSTRNTNRDL